MEHAPLSGEAPRLRLHGGPAPDGFLPMRLVLQPSGYAVDVTGPDVLVGRHSEADLRLPLPDVSRRHCRLQFAEGGWQVIDLNSLNGIQVNGEQVLQAPLEHGDSLRIGGFTFAVDLADGKGVEPTGHVHSILQTLKSAQTRRAS